MKFLRKNVMLLSCIVIFIIAGCYFVISNYLKKNEYVGLENENNDIVYNDEHLEEYYEEKELYVDIKGAVNNPGVYKVNENNKIMDVITLAGGLLKDADTSLINLAKKVSDQMVIYIYTKEEVKNSNIVDTVIKVVEKECVCPNIKNDGCINDDIDNTISNVDSNSKLVNINTASLTELQSLSGIGESKAKSIIKYREEIGMFKSIEELKNVDGIGDTLYEQIKIYITT